MEGWTRNRSGSRRTRFLDEARPSDTRGILERPSTAPDVLAVLHDALPDLGNRPKRSAVRVAEPSSTLADLTAEFNDLSRKMTMLGETIESNRNPDAVTDESGRLVDSSSQALHSANITSVATAKLLVHDCISELISINHFLDGNEEIAAVYREKLRHSIADEYGKPKDIIVQGISLGPNSPNTITSEGKSTADSSVGGADYFFRQYSKEAEIQTDSEHPELIETGQKSADESPDVSSMPTNKIGRRSRQAVEKKGRKWYSGCVCCANDEKSGKKPEATASKTSTSKKNRSTKR